MESNFIELKEKVEDWAEEKGIVAYENTDKQFMKFVEEVFEFKEELDNYKATESSYEFFKECDDIEEAEITRKNLKTVKNHMKLEFGDILVTLIILAKDLDIDVIECLGLAYNKIKDRKGKTINGTFVKEEDLK